MTANATKTSDSDRQFLAEAIRLAVESVAAGGGPFGAVVARKGQVLGRGANRVTLDCDPTAHAEIVALREACRDLSQFHLPGATVYASCEPCPMCLAACYWSQVERIVFAATRHDAAAAGFSDQFIYEEFARPLTVRRLPVQKWALAEAAEPFTAWQRHDQRAEY